MLIHIYTYIHIKAYKYNMALCATSTRMCNQSCISSGLSCQMLVCMYMCNAYYCAASYTLLTYLFPLLFCLL